MSHFRRFWAGVSRPKRDMSRPSPGAHRAGSQDDTGFVIVSCTVISATPIVQLAEHCRIGAQTDDFVYQVGRTSFTQPDGGERAARLATSIDGFIDLLERVPRSVLFAESTFVRVFLTLGAGAQTIDSVILRRLADVNATLWIDA